MADTFSKQRRKKTKKENANVGLCVNSYKSKLSRDKRYNMTDTINYHMSTIYMTRSEDAFYLQLITAEESSINKTPSGKRE